MNADLLFGFLVYLLILIVIFLILRQVMCWYWKININIGLQEEQIQLQEKTNKLLEKLVIEIKDISLKNEIRKVKSKETKEEINPKILSNEEIEIIHSKISSLTENEIIIIHSLSRTIKIINKSDFDESTGCILVNILQIKNKYPVVYL